MNLKYHFEVGIKELRIALDHFSWSSDHTKLAVKTAVSCTLSILICTVLNYQYAFWAGISALVVMQSHVALSVKKGWMRSGGAILGSILAIYFAGLLGQNVLIFSLAVFVFISIGLFTGAQCKYGYFWMYLFFHIIIIGMIAFAEPFSAFSIQTAFYRAMNVTIGVLVSLIINLILWPKYARDKLNDSVVEYRKNVFFFLETVMRQYLALHWEFDTTEEQYHKLVKQAESCKRQISAADFESRLFRGNRNIINTEFKSLTRTADHIWNFYYHVSTAEKHFIYQKEYTERFNQILEKLHCLASNYSSLRELDAELVEEINELFEKIEFEYGENIDGINQKYPVDEVIHFQEALFCIFSFFSNFTGSSADTVLKVEKSQKRRIEHPIKYLLNGRVLKEKLSIHLPTILYAMKGGIGVLFVFLLWSWLNIPGSGINIMISIAVILQLDPVDTNHKGILRFSGCLLGAVIGAPLLYFHMDSTMLIWAIIPCVIFILAFINGCGAGVAYFGLQAGIAFLIVVVPDSWGSPTIFPVLERLAGIFLGIICLWCIERIVWPVDFYKKLQLQLETVLSNLSKVGEYIRHAGVIFQKRSFLEKEFGELMDIKRIESTGRILLYQAELTEAQVGRIQEWLTTLTNVTENIYTIITTEEETARVLLDLNRNFMDDFANIITDISMGVSREAIRNNLYKLNTLNGQLDTVSERIRNERTLKSKGKDFRFKQEFAHYFLNIRRTIGNAIKLLELQRGIELTPNNKPTL